MNEFDREIGLAFLIDANCINARQKLPNMNQLEKWHKDGVISLEMPEPAQIEAMTGQDVRRIDKAVTYLFTRTLCTNDEEKKLLHNIEKILFNTAKDRNQMNDVEIVFNAHKYGCILITNDGASKSQPGGILGHKTELAELDIQVMTDTEAVHLIRDRIRVRDEAAIRRSKWRGLPIPDWVGKD